MRHQKPEEVGIPVSGIEGIVTGTPPGAVTGVGVEIAIKMVVQYSSFVSSALYGSLLPLWGQYFHLSQLNHQHPKTSPTST